MSGGAFDQPAAPAESPEPIPTLGREVRLVQNRALGGVLIWRFACGYLDAHPSNGAPPLPLTFLVIPLLYHEDTFDLLSHTQAGLSKFAEKFSQPAVDQTDVLLSIQSRVASSRRLSFDALRLAVSSRLVTIVAGTSEVVPLTRSAPTGVAKSVRPMLTAAERLGQWCAGQTLFEIAARLRIDF